MAKLLACTTRMSVDEPKTCDIHGPGFLSELLDGFHCTTTWVLRDLLATSKSLGHQNVDITLHSQLAVHSYESTLTIPAPTTYGFFQFSDYPALGKSYWHCYWVLYRPRPAKANVLILDFFYETSSR